MSTTEEKNILLDINGWLQLVSKSEYDKMEDELIEFDGVEPFTVLGKLRNNLCTEISSLHYTELKYAVHLANTVVGALEKYATDAVTKARIEKFHIACLALEDSSIHKAQEIFGMLRSIKLEDEQQLSDVNKQV